MIITYAQLRKAKACASQLALFKEHFGHGGEVTLAKVEGVATLFDWGWAARHLLSAESRAEYDRVEAATWAEHNRVTAPAGAEYGRVRAAASAEYNRVTAAAWFAGWQKDHTK